MSIQQPYAQNGWDSAASIFNGLGGIAANYGYNMGQQQINPNAGQQQTYNGSYINGLGTGWNPATSMASDPYGYMMSANPPYSGYPASSAQTAGYSGYPTGGAITPLGQAAQGANQVEQYGSDNMGPKLLPYLSRNALYK